MWSVSCWVPGQCLISLSIQIPTLLLQSHPHQNYSVCKLASHANPSIKRECTGHVDTSILFCLAFILLFVDLKISILILYLVIKLALLVQFSLPGINESEVLPKLKVCAEFPQMVLPLEASAGHPHPLPLPSSSYLVLMVLQACCVSCLWAFIQAVLSLSESTLSSLGSLLHFLQSTV